MRNGLVSRRPGKRGATPRNIMNVDAVERSTVLIAVETRGSRARVGWSSAIEIATIFLVVIGRMYLVGRDDNWDQRNAHVASLHWFFERSRSNDLPIGDGIGVFLPAMWAAPWYLAVRAKLFWVAQVALLANSIAPLLILRSVGRRMVRRERPTWTGPGVTIALVAFALTSATLTEIGTTMGNLVTAGLLLLGLDASLRSLAEKHLQRLARAGLFCGMAFGLKWTNVVYIAPIVLLVLMRFGPRGWRALVRFGVPSILGTLLTGGYVFFANWRRYRSPMFPFYNGLFKSDWWDEAAWHYDPYRMKSPLSIMSFPIDYALGTRRGSESFVRDPRLLIAAVCALVLVITTLRSRRSVFADRLTLTAVWWLVSYVIWAFQFGIHRYLIVLELSGSLLCMSAAARLVQSGALRKVSPFGGRAGAAVVSILVMVITVSAHTEHLPWASEEVYRHDIVVPNDTLLVFSMSPRMSATTILFSDRLDRVGLAFAQRSSDDGSSARQSDRIQQLVVQRVTDQRRRRLLIEPKRWRFDEKILQTLGVEVSRCWEPEEAGSIRLCWLRNSP